jgi:hypothetical protein
MTLKGHTLYFYLQRTQAKVMRIFLKDTVVAGVGGSSGGFMVLLTVREGWRTKRWEKVKVKEGRRPSSLALEIVKAAFEKSPPDLGGGRPQIRCKPKLRLWSSSIHRILCSYNKDSLCIECTTLKSTCMVTICPLCSLVGKTKYPSRRLQMFWNFSDVDLLKMDGPPWKSSLFLWHGLFCCWDTKHYFKFYMRKGVPPI